VVSFLQSPEWEKFQHSLGRKTWRVFSGTSSGKRQEGEVLLIRHDLPAGFNYLYCPRPAALNDRCLLEAEKIARKEKSIFLKIDPTEEISISHFRFQTARSLQPSKTILLDLSLSPRELLCAMQEKTRYNIRLAERRGVRVWTADARVSAFENFWRLLQETAQRGGFGIHGREHYEKLLLTRSDNFSNELFLAEYGGKVIAAALVNFYQDATSPGTATYLHGASGREHRQVMAPHFLHWSIIKEAKERGFKFYDLGGIDEKKWPGLTRFKLGFGGKRVEYPASIDLIYRPAWYWVYKLARNIF